MNEIGEAGRRQRFEQWEKLGLERVKNDLLNGGHQLIGGPPHDLPRFFGPRLAGDDGSCLLWLPQTGR